MKKSENLLIKFELVKLINKIFFVCVCFVLYIILSSTLFYRWSQHEASFVNEDGEYENVTGKEAFYLEKKLNDKHKGELSIEVLQEALSDYNDKIEEFALDGNSIWYTEYLFINRLFIDSFSPYNSRQILIKDSLTNEDLEDFYANRLFKIEHSLQMPENEIHSTPLVKKLAEKIHTPFYYDGYFYAWKRINDFGYQIIDYVIFMIILCASFVFFNETAFSTTIHFSLPTVNGRKECALAKIKALIIFSSLIYITVIGLNLLLTFISFGVDGGNSPIQIISFLSLYNLTIKQFLILYFIICYFVTVFFALLTFYLSFYLKNIISVIIISGSIFYAGKYIPQGSILERFVFLFPSSVIDRNYLMSRPIVYNFFGHPVLLGYMYIPACIVLSIILAVLIVRKYKRLEY